MACSKCGLIHQCICPSIPQLQSELHLSLLTHTNEYLRESNTGRWLEYSLPFCQRYEWKRTEANPDLLTKIAPDSDSLQHSVLLFPTEDSRPLEDVIVDTQVGNTPLHFIILDGTWQEAKKMERKSPWLDNVERVAFTPSHSSHYRLRRNQEDNHLCTLEVAAELLRMVKEEHNADKLNDFFLFMMDSVLADKSGHALKR